MIRIALCDDNQDELNSLKQLTEEIMQTTGEAFVCDCFADGHELLAGIFTEILYDLVITDIIMPNLGGVDMAKKIYAKNKVTKFIFLTSSPEFAVESYAVEALDYILKPVEKTRLKKAVNKFLDKRETEENDEIIIRDKSGLARIMLRTIYYVETRDHYVIYHTSDGGEIACRQNLAEAEVILLKSPCFIKTSRSYIVNMEYIDKIDQGCITMKSGEKIYASRAYLKDLPEKFLRFKFDQKTGGK